MQENGIAKTMNSQLLVYNVAPLAIGGALVFFLLGLVLGNEFVGGGLGVAGFLVGQYLAKFLHTGQAQGYIFYYTPLLNWYWKEAVPPSHATFEL